MHPAAPPPLAHAARDGDGVDFGVADVLRVVAKDGSSADLAAIARDVARMDGPADRPADVHIRFVEALSPIRLRILDGGSMGYDDQGVYVLDPWDGEPIARVSQGQRWGRADIVCARAPGRVPLLSVALDLAALAGGRAPIHGSAWVTPDGRGVLVSGWAHSGKTGALLAACEAGAVPVGDDRIFLSPDRSMVGTGRPVGVKAWHMAQLSLHALGRHRVSRTVAGALSSVGAFSRGSVGRRSRLAAKALGRLRRAFGEELPPDRLGDAPAGARADVLIILETDSRASIEVEPADPSSVARRVAAQMEVELTAALRAQSAFKYVLGDVGWCGMERAPGMALNILEDVAPGIPSYVVRHPYPCSLRDLVGAIDGILAEV